MYNLISTFYDIFMVYRYARESGMTETNWNDVTVPELQAFLAIFIVMGIKKLPQMDMYWSTNDMIGCPWISQTMTRARFQMINRFLHVANNAEAVNRGEPGYNPLFKVQPLIDHLKAKFAQWYYPRKCLSIDEAMIGFNGRLSFKQYIPSKPTKWGIKVWEICESKTGFCLDFDVYTGKNREFQSRFGVGFDVVSKLSSRFLNKFHCMYFDRFFTGVDIIEYLLRNNTYACGTVRSNRKGLPKGLKRLKMRRGQTKTFQKTGSSLMLTLFKDRKLVHMLSSNSEHSLLDTGKPKVIDDFNKNMGGVDLNDQLCMYYKAGRPSHKWWRYVFFFLLNVSVTNAWILFKESGRGNGYTHVKFCMDLAEKLRNNFTSRIYRTPELPAELVLERVNGHDLVRIEGRSRTCKVCLRKGIKTVRGYRKESSYECEQCKAALCRRPCFFDFHTPAQNVEN